MSAVEGMAEGFGPLVRYGEVPEVWRMDGSIAGSTTFVR